jgi:dTDP-4-dehydrorhamnose 3,5-epimerase-like enzyme
MIFNPTFLAGSFIIEQNVLEDDRGWFARFIVRMNLKK